MKWFFWPPFSSVSPLLLLNLARRQSYAYAIGLCTRPEIKSWPDIKFCAHAHCVLPRCWQEVACGSREPTFLAANQWRSFGVSLISVGDWWRKVGLFSCPSSSSSSSSSFALMLSFLSLKKLCRCVSLLENVFSYCFFSILCVLNGRQTRTTSRDRSSSNRLINRHVCLTFRTILCATVLYINWYWENFIRVTYVLA